MNALNRDIKKLKVVYTPLHGTGNTITERLLKELGLQSYAEYESNNSKKIMLLDGFDELCMLDGMAEFAESILSEIIRGFSDTYMVITTRPKFLNSVLPEISA